MTQTALTQYDELVELPVPSPQEVGRCELCGRLSSMYPVIYNALRNDADVLRYVANHSRRGEE